MAGLAGLRGWNVFDRILPLLGQLACAIMAGRTGCRRLDLCVVEGGDLNPLRREFVMAGFA